jgi:flagellar assembly factor FliW
MSPNAALALVEETPAAERMVTVDSDLLGTLSVPARGIFTFPAGMFGFPECRRFALVSAGREGLFWLQSLQHSALTFLLADPFPHVPGYGVELGPADRVELQARTVGEVAVLCIVTLPRRKDEQPTMNLRGPLAINVGARVGRQLVLEEGRWDVRAPLPL